MEGVNSVEKGNKNRNNSNNDSVCIFLSEQNAGLIYKQNIFMRMFHLTFAYIPFGNTITIPNIYKAKQMTSFSAVESFQNNVSSICLFYPGPRYHIEN